MSEKPQSKDEALDALDFIVNVLKEHERELDKLIAELGTVTEQLGGSGELGGKVEKIEQRISGLQNEVSVLVNYLSSPPRQAHFAIKEHKSEAAIAPKLPFVGPVMTHGPPVVLRCKNWEDFQTLAFQAQTLSFTHREAEKTFQADALKGNQIMTYSGELPKLTALLKIWLSKQLDVTDKKILEGVLAIS